MEWNLITIGLLLVVLIIGYLIGLLEARLKSARKEGPPARLAANKTLPSLEARSRSCAPGEPTPGN